MKKKLSDGEKLETLIERCVGSEGELFGVALGRSRKSGSGWMELQKPRLIACIELGEGRFRLEIEFGL
jgi:hypothetical protein